ncbi:hypothetical protein [Aliivibrio sifiae]|uniref:Uncharacterized protein n=1 Tax=Aliivibrio sifiae TaxID=566293 RepID=A0A2S7X1X6_9GAMM|nr:hypothetical protein [Aliivibrio sifiae]PQJ84227.1 hypothetical protein BTO22_11780 [Aliivibrio sifiae]
MKYIQIKVTIYALFCFISSQSAANTTDVEITNDAMLVSYHGGVCPSDYTIMPVETARENRLSIGNNLMGQYEILKLAGGYVITGSGHGYDIKLGSAYHPVCVANKISNIAPSNINQNAIPDNIEDINSELSNSVITDLSNVYIDNYEIYPEGAGGAIPNQIYANGIMQSQVTVRARLKHNNESGALITTPITDINSAISTDGKKINFIRLYTKLGEPYDPNKKIEIAIDGEHVGLESTSWKASRQENKYEKSILSIREGNQESSYLEPEIYTLDNGWHTFTYWVTTTKATASGLDMQICARIGNENGVNLADTCRGKNYEHISYAPIAAIPIPNYIKSDFIISDNRFYHNDHQRVDLREITITPKKPNIKIADIYINAIPYNQPRASTTRIENMSLVARYTETYNAQPGQRRLKGASLFVMNKYGNESYKDVQLKGYDYWNETNSEFYPSSVELHPNANNITFLSTTFYNHFIAAHSYIGWNLDPLRYGNNNYFSPEQKNNVKARDQYGNAFDIKFNYSNDYFNIDDIHTINSIW